ncbi:MAG: BamA/TamA family outer membrane protein [Bacteroidales bacterium]|nr:BamA/TamA family outer membrane protein [Bacteroidales bacterium]
MKSPFASRASWFLLFLFIFSGCSVTKNLASKEYLLIKNKIIVIDHKVPIEDLEPYLQQHPNKKLFGLFRTNIAFYNMGSQGKETKFKKWIRTSIGTAPVILDTSMVAVSLKQMGLYLGNKGFFQSGLSDTIRYNKKKAIVEYYIRPSKQYKIREIRYSIPDTQVASFVYKDTARSLIRRGKSYDAYILDDERSRITTNLQNAGFYHFSNTYIVYRVDSNFRKCLMDITLEITNPVVPSLENLATVEQIPHKRYFINKIYIYPEFDHLIVDTNKYDTLVMKYESYQKGQPPNTYYFLYKDKFKVKPRTIAQSIFVTPGSNFNLHDVNQSYSQLSGLQVFKYINLQFKEPNNLSLIRPVGQGDLDCNVELSRSPAQSFTITADGTNSGGAFGVQGNLGYQNRNLFKGAQLFRINLSGSLQMQASMSSENNFFNTVELGANAGITFPQFLIPIRPETLPKNFKPKTTISIGYNYQHQQDYDRHISNITFGYSWLQNEMIKHILNPVEVSLVKVFKDAYFDSMINSQQDQRLKNQYTDHMVAGLRYTFQFSNQKINKTKNFFYIRANFETGGNLIYAVDELFKVQKSDSGGYTMFNLPYSQYFRPDVDFRFYEDLGNKFSMVYRFYGGIGVPYGNSTLLPFEKSFFAGGANGMRGWKMYNLGPGSYHDDEQSSTFSQIGSMQLEANVEYRFPIYQWIRGSLFVDAGNIWLLKESQDLPGGKFSFPGFIDQIAIDAGFGIRLDFDFFIFRFDPAIPIRVPWYPENDRWYFDKMQFKDIIWNFGIGYPF